MDAMWVFVDIFLLTFGLFLILAGAFTAYFGSGKSRGIGVGLLVLGIIMGLVVAIMHMQDIHTKDPLMDILKEALVYLSAAIFGALLAIGVFLVAIMKS